jgi:hypothetical protein
LNLVNQIKEKAKLPQGGLVTYKHNTNKHINIVEDWMVLENDESCNMRIGIVVESIIHEIKFEIKKADNNFILKVIIASIENKFNFEISSLSDVQAIQFDEVVSFIIDSIINTYDHLRY